MNIAVNEHFGQFIEEQVKAGRFQSADELVEEGLRLVELRETRTHDLKAHIEAALAEEVWYTDEEVEAFLNADGIE